MFGLFKKQEVSDEEARISNYSSAEYRAKMICRYLGMSDDYKNDLSMESVMKLCERSNYTYDLEKLDIMLEKAFAFYSNNQNQKIKKKQLEILKLLGMEV